MTSLEDLRRPYTRTISTSLRSISVLEASLEDVRQQWAALMADYSGKLSLLLNDLSQTAGSHSNSSFPSSTASIRGSVTASVERITSQLKAVKQELIAHLNCLLPESSSYSCGEDGGVAFVKKGAPNSEAAFLSALAPYMKSETLDHAEDTPDRQSQDALSSKQLPYLQPTYLETLWLSRRVWVWSVLFSVLLVDLDVLPGSIALADALYFCSDGCNGDARARYNGYGVLSETVLQRFARDSGRDVEAECCEVYFFFVSWFKLQSHIKRSVNHSESRDGMNVSPIPDSVLVKGCVVLYSVLVADIAAAEDALSNWRASLAAETLGTAATEGGPDAHAIMEFMLFITNLVNLLNTEDYIAVRHYLDAVETNTSRHCDGSGSQTHAYKMVKLLVRALMECEVRRRWVQSNFATSFRPIPSVETAAAAAGAHQPDEVSVAAQATQYVSYHVRSALRANCEDLNESNRSASNGSSGSHGAADVLRTSIQLSCLERLCGPWPLCPPLVEAISIV